MSEGEIPRSIVRGVIAAMAMTGMRRVTVGLGLLPEPPPEEIAREGVPKLFARVPPEHRDEVLELAHWGYGAAAGAAFATLPRDARHSVWGGTLYGLATWAFFELCVAPVLGLRSPRERTVSERLALVADHLLYGLVVAARPERR